jgi:hypothetical protein
MLSVAHQFSTVATICLWELVGVILEVEHDTSGHYMSTSWKANTE